MYTLILMSSRKNSVRQHTIHRRHILFCFFFVLLLFTIAIGGFTYGLSQKHQRINFEAEIQANTQKQIEEITQEKLRVESELTDMNEEMKTIHKMTEQIRQTLGIFGQGGGDSRELPVSETAEETAEAQQADGSRIDNTPEETDEKQEPLTPSTLKDETLALYDYVGKHQEQIDEYPSILPVDLQHADGEKHAYWYSSQFGWRMHPLTKKREFHQGLDIKTPAGIPVIAAAAGTVGAVKTNGYLGKTVEINHETLLLKTLYAHLEDYADNLKVGQQVTRGQLIGYVGNTGRSTGTHLHYGIYDMEKEQWINPIKYILDQQPTISP